MPSTNVPYGYMPTTDRYPSLQYPLTTINYCNSCANHLERALRPYTSLVLSPTTIDTWRGSGNKTTYITYSYIPRIQGPGYTCINSRMCCSLVTRLSPRPDITPIIHDTIMQARVGWLKQLRYYKWAVTALVRPRHGSNSVEKYPVRR